MSIFDTPDGRRWYKDCVLAKPEDDGYYYWVFGAEIRIPEDAKDAAKLEDAAARQMCRFVEGSTIPRVLSGVSCRPKNRIFDVRFVYPKDLDIHPVGEMALRDYETFVSDLKERFSDVLTGVFTPLYREVQEIKEKISNNA